MRMIEAEFPLNCKTSPPPLVLGFRMPIGVDEQRLNHIYLPVTFFDWSTN